MLEVVEVSVYNGQNGRNVDVTFGGQVIQFSTFPLDIAAGALASMDGNVVAVAVDDGIREETALKSG